MKPGRAPGPYNIITAHDGDYGNFLFQYISISCQICAIICRKLYINTSYFVSYSDSVHDNLGIIIMKYDSRMQWKVC